MCAHRHVVLAAGGRAESHTGGDRLARAHGTGRPVGLLADCFPGLMPQRSHNAGRSASGKSTRCSLPKPGRGTWPGPTVAEGHRRLQRSEPVPHPLRLRRATGPHRRPASAHRCAGSREPRPLGQAHVAQRCSCIRPLSTCPAERWDQAPGISNDRWSGSWLRWCIRRGSNIYVGRLGSISCSQDVRLSRVVATKDFTGGPLSVRPCLLGAPDPEVGRCSSPKGHQPLGIRSRARMRARLCSPLARPIELGALLLGGPACRCAGLQHAVKELRQCRPEDRRQV
jgi:hypothetical protein